jgi:hypothetical protein
MSSPVPYDKNQSINNKLAIFYLNLEIPNILCHENKAVLFDFISVTVNSYPKLSFPDIEKTKNCCVSGRRAGSAKEIWQGIGFCK